MKKISLFILLAMPLCLLAQQPIFPLFAQNPKWRIYSWNYNGSAPPIIYTHEYFYQKDTVVAGKTYSKLMYKINEGAAQFDALVRNEGKKTFIRQMLWTNTFPTLSEEYGLYDFDLRQNARDEFIFGPTRIFFPYDTVCIAVFSSTDSLNFMGQKRKRIFANFEIPSRRIRSTQPMQWIEGFGTFNNPFYHYQCFFCPDTYYTLMCMEMNGVTIYQDTVKFPNCSPIRVSTNDLNKKKITISPNPTSDIVHLTNVENVNKIQLFAFDGRLIRVFDNEHFSNISLSNLSDGIYFLAFSDKNGALEVRKVVKIH
jgi:Secretion system C-terminal sorting domain